MAKAKINLVIVESPAKARTIEKYLGAGYKVVASMGHLRDLPKSTLGVDVDNSFEPKYIPVKGREDVIAELKKHAKAADIVYLATDPDREGEAISWHLKELLNLTDDRARRVTFNEITKKVVQESIAAPRDINQDLVNAQQARRILDRIVGYKLSPLLWKKIRRGLSAGRVQSVATRMVVDREREIRAFNQEEYWLLDAIFASLPGEGEGEYAARFFGDAKGKIDLHSEAETDGVVAAVTDKPFFIKTVKRGDKQRSPSPPFITSTLQQEASRRLGMTPRRTMSIAQQLYEGVDIAGHGTVGLITYMRTDSLRLSDEALGAAKDYIIGRYGVEFYHGSPRRYKTRAGAQDAHEAIRPTYVDLSPEQVRKDLTQEQYRLYRLIWGRFTACQMSNAIYENVVIDTECAGYIFRSNYSEQRFAGYTAVYEEAKDEESEDVKKPLPNLAEGAEVTLEKTSKEQQFTQPPTRYTEATLIRGMEEKGIGRPSTYAPTISTITSREYVVKEGRYLKPTPLGEVVTGLMEERFPDIVDLKFTAHMEDNLDKIEEGSSKWQSVLDDFYKGFNQELTDAETAMEGERIKVPDEVSDEICPNCGKNLVIKSGRFGRFLACPGYPDCSFTKPIVIEMPGKCPLCGGRILKRTSKNGYTFYACERGKDCGFMSWDVPTKDFCPECGKTLFKRGGKGQRKPFCANPECKDFLPEDKRGYKKKTVVEGDKAENAEAADGAEKPEAAKKPAAKKPAAKKPAAKKAPAAKKPAAKKPAAKKAPAAKKTAEEKAAPTEKKAPAA
ncbi:MAG: type I DNA topoisomerase, partial [Oscillospiraceae bacterium]